jgi:hypothetical protein
MAISVNLATKLITVPQSDLTSVSGTLYELDVDWFRLALKDFEDGEDGIVMPTTHNHNTVVVLSGVSYARAVEIINGYTVAFQDTGSPYTVRCVGANHNLADVFVPGTSEVSLIIGNSAGLIQVSSGSGLSSGQATQLDELHKLHGLAAGVPLVVTDTSRSAGTIEQDIETAGSTVTVTRG